MHGAGRRDRTMRGMRSTLALLALLAVAGCFRIDDDGEDALEDIPWNPPPAIPGAPPPVVGADAAPGAPPSAQDAAGPPVIAPPADAAADAFFQGPGPGPTDAGNALAQDGGASDGGAGDSGARDGGPRDGGAGASDARVPRDGATTFNFSVPTTSLGAR
jgi:hypothetical protein